MMISVPRRSATCLAGVSAHGFVDPALPLPVNPEGWSLMHVWGLLCRGGPCRRIRDADDILDKLTLVCLEHGHCHIVRILCACLRLS